MKRRALVLLLLPTLAWAQRTVPLNWSIEPTPGATYEFAEARGHVHDQQGAELVLRHAGGDRSQTGRVGASVSAMDARMRRVTISGELRTLDAPEGATVWLRVERKNGTPLTDYGANVRVRGGMDWSATVPITLPVPEDATSISFGIRLWTGGTVAARRLRLHIGEPLNPAGPAAADAAAKLEAAIALVKKHGLRRNAVSWPALERQVRTLASVATNAVQVNSAIALLLAEAADPSHSSVMSAAQWNAMNTGQTGGRPPQSRAERGVGVIELFEYPIDDPARNREYISTAYMLLEQAALQAPCGWVIDLRRNGGGNVVPMLGAMKPFLGDASLGSNVGPDGPQAARIATSDVALPQATAALVDAPVAVLIGPGTGSSGERVAISFRGRARTRLFGQPSRGLTTANSAFDLPDGSKLVITQSVMADRTGRRYGGKVEPDTFVEPSPMGSLADAVVDAAARWLKEESKCLGR